MKTMRLRRSAKRLELLRELVPGAARVALLVEPANVRITERTVRDVEAAAHGTANPGPQRQYQPRDRWDHRYQGDVRLAGDTALVTGRAAIEAEINGQPRSLRLVFLNAWTKTPKGWKFIAWQSTPQPTT
jgi:hypothetical protein